MAETPDVLEAAKSVQSSVATNPESKYLRGATDSLLQEHLPPPFSPRHKYATTIARLPGRLLERRQLLDVLGLVVVLNREAELDHAVDAARKGRRLVQGEARGEERRLEEEVDEVLDLRGTRRGARG